ncbi:hypothetical protein [Metabacillus fastidiosus]|uniref:hypothetical protein n=1 Tax=Metabacillus fastidiosus TaxID=1458 RepID=UPI002E233F37|nr:hypothetical protein [Metabacillus fastidiosus]
MEWYWYLLITWVICFGLTLAYIINSEKKKDEDKNSKVMIVIISFVLSFFVPLWFIYFVGTVVKSIYAALDEQKYAGFK